jgi:hypothetical protein
MLAIFFSAAPSHLRPEKKVLPSELLADFNGNYASFAAGITIAGGSGGATMRNQNGVILNVVATTQGLKFQLGVDGMKIELIK